MSDLDSPPGDPLVDGALAPRAVIDALSRAVVVTALDGEIVSWNRAAEELYGWSASDVLGRSVVELMVPVSDVDLAEDVFAHVIAGGTWKGDFTVRCRDGDTRRVYAV